MNGANVGRVGIRFNEVMNMEELFVFEPNYYFIKLHVDHKWLLTSLLSTTDDFSKTFPEGNGGYFTYGRLSVIVDHLLAFHEHAQGCTFDGLVSVLGDLLDECLVKINENGPYGYGAIELEHISPSGVCCFKIIN